MHQYTVSTTPRFLTIIVSFPQDYYLNYEDHSDLFSQYLISVYGI